MEEVRKLTAEDYKRIASYVSGFTPEMQPYDMAFYDKRQYEFEEAEAFPKQRPKKGRNGFYTPNETRKYEALVKQWGKDCGMQPVAYPVAVRLVVRDYTLDPLLRTASIAGVVFNDHGDLDNFTKAILDGLNKVLVKDDRQIVRLEVDRRYSYRRGFSLTVARAGLSKNEWAQVRKFL